tara:strand:+ start:5733 stop:6164 length:432 start_codon:yes stop_codon:yes gene_type:complete
MGARFLERAKGLPPTGEIETQGDHEEPGNQITDRDRRTQVQLARLGADQADCRAGDGVARDASGIVAKMMRGQRQGRSPPVLCQTGIQRPHDTATHADTMCRAQQADRQRGIERILHKQAQPIAVQYRGGIANAPIFVTRTWY